MHVRRPVKPMLAKSVDQIPTSTADSNGLCYEPKWDGYRAIAICGESGSVELYSRNDKPLDHVFPEIVGALFAELPRGTVVDGEIVRWNNNRLDFECLQRRFRNRARANDLAAVEPAHFICFDALEAASEDQRHLPLTERRQVLEELFRRIPSVSPLQLGMHTSSYYTALAWNRDLAAVGVEGIVAKPASSTYQQGQRGAWLKVKRFVTTEAIVGGYTGSPERPLELLLGRYNSTTGELDIAGRSSAIDGHLAAQLAALLQPAGPDHPWPEELPQHWMTDRDPSPYTRVQPTLVVEIRADPATGAGKWRHKQRVFRLRDVDPAEVPLDLNIES